LKEVKSEEMRVLQAKGIIKNSSNGFVNKEGVQVGFYRTRNKRYLEDSYVDIAKRLINGG
jgi:hypothetical protein